MRKYFSLKKKKHFNGNKYFILLIHSRYGGTTYQNEKAKAEKKKSANSKAAIGEKKDKSLLNFNILYIFLFSFRIFQKIKSA